jgi:hypothetical protein
MFEKLLAAFSAERESHHEEEAKRLRALNKKKTDQCKIAEECLAVSYREVGDLILRGEVVDKWSRETKKELREFQESLERKDWDIERLKNQVITLNQCIEIQVEVIERDRERARCEKLIARVERAFAQSGSPEQEPVIKDDQNAST